MNTLNIERVQNERENVEGKIKKMLILEQIFSEDEEFIYMVNKIKTMINNH
ncbi:uncharacterized protein KNN_02283 [Bacillus thuringiensis serovar tolworthi]|uniref:Uncharacterized protein n=1 Tax=Bacillus thuringiensis subsp. tolworthi TaxID=1442 RepID=A0A9W4ETX6_BACTO|nr:MULTISPECIES: hypothetical protein [Bacillus cereus group]MEB8713182.1 hypothetical protein [Bacillus cereus]MEB8856852.1 hypothetical protein [Bacillus cereus]MEB9433778.1 hypothetical protein [Bacillus cereus]MEB9479491.1 hypothetical protein [Bacillus cereus]MEB9591805.1 hypothetical protein [Bacillus cereus]